MMVRSVAERAVRAKRPAFTLLEVLIVVAIIVMLAGVGGYFLIQRYEEAKVSRAKIDCVALADKVGIYYTRTGHYPGSIAELAQNQADGGSPMIPMDKVNDPWGKPYQLDTSGANGVEIRVFTTGPRQQPIDNTGATK